MSNIDRWAAVFIRTTGATFVILTPSISSPRTVCCLFLLQAFFQLLQEPRSRSGHVFRCDVIIAVFPGEVYDAKKLFQPTMNHTGPYQGWMQQIQIHCFMDHHPFIQCVENLTKAVLATRAAEQRTNNSLIRLM